jgi:anionic cell wall polymer biosynthesis LytR-Cps2A-Psr (LCP) family protein
MNGKQALGFVRERYAFRDGDNQRGKNQMAVIQAIVDKAVSPAFLSNFSDLMKSIEGSFETSMSSAQISSLVRMQLDEGGSWDVFTYAAEGRSAMMPVYSMSTEQSVMIPNEKSIARAKKLINMVYDGKVLSEQIIEDIDNDKITTGPGSNDSDSDDTSKN